MNKHSEYEINHILLRNAKDRDLKSIGHVCDRIAYGRERSRKRGKEKEAFITVLEHASSKDKN